MKTSKPIIDYRGFQILANPYQYTVKRPGAPEVYFSDLELCFREIFEHDLKTRLIENSEKQTIEEMLRIVKETSEDIKTLIRKTYEIRI